MMFDALDREKRFGCDFGEFDLHSEITDFKKSIKIKDSWNNIKKIDNRKFKKNLSNIIETNAYDFLNRTSLEVFTSSLLIEIENNFSVKIDENTRELLSIDLDLIMALKDISKNSGMVKHLDFKYEGIEYVQDPDEPDSNILTIYINIKEKDIKKLIEKRDIIIEELCKNLDIEIDEKISIVNIFS